MKQKTTATASCTVFQLMYVIYTVHLWARCAKF